MTTFDKIAEAFPNPKIGNMVKVKIKSSSIFGGVDEKKKNKIENNEAHTIYINATCIFGGAEVK